MRNNDNFTRIFSTNLSHFVVLLAFKRIHDNKQHVLFSVTFLHFYLFQKTCPEPKTFEKMKNFGDSLYDCDYSGVNDEESSDEEEAAIVIETDQSKPFSHTAANQSKLVSYTGPSWHARL